MLSKIKLLALLSILTNVCFGQIPILNSSPSITNKVIYLDFDGQVVSGTAWNSGNTVNALASTMSNNNIITIWKRLIEDYRPFDVNVTTDSMRFNTAPPNKRIRVIVTPTSSWYGSAGGVAYVGSFTWGGTPGTPCWVFENQLSNSTKNIAEAAAHEVGHTLTLRHQSLYNPTTCSKTAEYNPGTGSGTTSWAPIMGVGYSKNVTIWHTGTSANGCTVIQYDHGNSGTGLTSTNYLSFLPDDVGNTLATSKILNLTNINLSDSGIITEPTDKDAYQFTICNNRHVTIGVKPYALDTTSYNGADLDVRLFLYNAANSVLAVDTPLTRLQGLIGLNLTPGTYYFTVDGGRATNYNDYGSLGKYFIKIKATNPPAIGNSIVTPSALCAGQTTTLTYTSNGIPTQWQWTVSGPSATTFTTQNPSMAFSAGVHTISLLAISGTSSSCLETITVNIGSPPTLTVSSFTGLLCPGRTTTLTAGGAPSYTWLPGGYSGATQIIMPFVTTSYTIYGSNGTCISSVVRTVSVSPNFTVTATTSATRICAGQSVTLTANGANSYTFNPGGIIANPAVLTPSSTTSFVVTGKNGTCTKTKAITVTVTPHFDVNIIATETLICEGGSATLTASGASNSTYTFNPGGFTGNNIVITPSANTIYTVTGKGAFQCLEDTTISIDLKDCLGEATGISLQKTESSFHIFPNPSHGSFVIEAGIPGNSVEILNAVGQLIYSKALPEKETLIHTESWTSGIYFVKLYKEGKNIYTEKIVVE